MIAEATKLCRTCNTIRPRTEFYISQRRASGRHKLMAKCKLCQRKVAADRKRKGNAPYMPYDPNLVVTKRGPSQRTIEERQWKCRGLLEWGKALRRQMCRLLDKSHAREGTAWQRWAVSAHHSLITRSQRHKPRTRKSAPRQWKTWNVSVRTARVLLRERLRRAAMSQWERTMSTKMRNLIQRANQQSRRRVSCLSS